MVTAAKKSPPVFVKEVLRPGVYTKGGEQYVFTPADVSDFFSSLRRLHDETGFRVPLLREHVPQKEGQRDGVPFDPAEYDPLAVEAGRLARTVGRSAIGDPRTRINANGGLDIAFEVPDEDTAKQLSTGLVEFVSPELRWNGWQDGKGRQFSKLITHVALTHRPIVTDQRRGFEQFSATISAPPDVLQLSFYDYAGVIPVKKKPKPLSISDRQAIRKLVQILQLSDDEFPPKKKVDGDGDGKVDEGEEIDETPEPSAPLPVATNPDLPANDGASQQMEALLAHLAKRGVALPSDTTAENLTDRLLTAVMSLNASDDLRETDDADESGESSMLAQEINPMTTAQMSATSNPRKALVDRVRTCKSMPAELRDTLLVRLGTTQFSATGAERVPAGSMGISELVEMYEQQAVQFSDGSPQAALAARIKRMRGVNIEPAVADQLLARVGAVQFSDNGTEVAGNGLTISALLDSMETARAGIGKLLGDSTAQLSGNSNDNDGAPHPRGRQFTSGATPGRDASDPATVQLSTELLERTGNAPKKDNRLAINATEARRPSLG